MRELIQGALEESFWNSIYTSRPHAQYWQRVDQVSARRRRGARVDTAPARAPRPPPPIHRAHTAISYDYPRIIYYVLAHTQSKLNTRKLQRWEACGATDCVTCDSRRMHVPREPDCSCNLGISIPNAVKSSLKAVIRNKSDRANTITAARRYRRRELGPRSRRGLEGPGGGACPAAGRAPPPRYTRFLVSVSTTLKAYRAGSI
ncbi:hypothetical protein EVAR_29611_1 [Eumeta japonica]|uniref:Uncharacterized protein n=1 Tax=Eumeta variegata TaxID=151549 RepID=A0A4C1VWP6_EUMVA|nr:hypothetical protein EVAR_29611_1 [Eumeta japonica]